MAARRKKKNRFALWVLALVLALGIFGVYKVLGPNTGKLTKGEYLYIPTGSDYNALLKQLEEGEYVSDLWSFNIIAKRAGFPNKVKAGKYKIERGMSNFNLIRMLRSGRQVPVKLVINKLRTKQDLITLATTNLEPSADSINALLHDTTLLAEYGLDTNTVMCAIVPDTYEFYWNTSATNLFKKIAKNYKTFWSEERIQKAAAKNLTQQQCIIIASIVEEETNMNDEKGNVASVYINRMKTGMPLQADPTIKFALNDFAIRRVTGVHLQVASPYNTYKSTGLPPGPICTPSKKTVDAVLNSPDTKYIYFCAREDFSGYHNFATNLNDHLVNARKYQQALNARGIH